MTFCGSFRKNVAGIECATHDERLYNACIWLKKIQFAKNFLKMPKSHLGHFQKRSSGSFFEMFLRILQNSQEMICTGVSS